MLDKTKPGWWKSAVIYQIYPKSFQDSNGDGIGDLPGITSRLDYLQQLGIDAIWLSPIFASPQIDNGYDISDYQAIDPMFGTMHDMEVLLREANARGISILLDLVLNHSSDQHRWFLEAKKSRENPYHDYYIWRDGTPDTPPNEMCSVFGGTAWEWVPELGQYYFHQFAPQQPDLNWDNPAVREEIYRMIRWWMEKGVGGFRLDVIDQIAKEPDFGITVNGPHLHEYLRELNAQTFGGTPLVTVGEAWGADVEKAKLFSNPDGSELSMIFQFKHMVLDQQPGKEKWDMIPLDLLQLKEVLEHWQEGLYGCGWNSLFWNNHDLPRIVSRWGDDGFWRIRSAKMLATLLHGMQGTPYIYQGEEIGMTNIHLEIGQYRDIETLNMYRERKAKGVPEKEIMASIYARGRDNARTPMQWDASEHAGFTTATPWMPVNSNYPSINVAESLEDPDSVLQFYRTLIRLRKEYTVFAEGKFHLLFRDDPRLFVYERLSTTENLLVICNFSAEPAPFQLPEDWRGADLLISNVNRFPENMLQPYEAAILLQKNKGAL